jgi:hypothetical protein
MRISIADVLAEKPIRRVVPGAAIVTNLAFAAQASLHGV